MPRLRRVQAMNPIADLEALAAEFESPQQYDAGATYVRRWAAQLRAIIAALEEREKARAEERAEERQRWIGANAAYHALQVAVEKVENEIEAWANRQWTVDNARVWVDALRKARSDGRDG